MPDSNTGTGAGVGDTKGGSDGAGTGQSATDATKSGAGQQAQPFDSSKIGDEDFQKVLEDPRLWQHPRIASLREKAKIAEKLQAEQAKAKEDQLAKDKKFEELASVRERERDNAILDSRLTIAAVEVGTVSVDAVLKLVDRSKLVKDDSGQYTNIKQVVEELIKANPYLKAGGGSKTLGTGTSPGSTGDDGKYKFKHSQIQDPVFYKAHEKEILEALKNNQIEQDLPM